MDRHGGGPRCPAAVASVRGHPARLGFLGLGRDLERRRLRRATDQETSDPARLPHPHRRASHAHARQDRRTGNAVRAGPPAVAVHGRGPRLGRHRPPGADRLRRRRPRRGPRTIPLRLPQSPHQRTRPRHLETAPTRAGGRPEVPPRGIRLGRAARTRENRSTDGPAPTFTAEAHRWSWSLRTNNQANATTRSIQEPAGTLFFGHRANECVWVRQPASGPDDQGAAESIRITAAEAGVLQTFPADYPWQGNKGQQFSQIGNAVPPRMAAHLLAPHLGKTWTPDDFTLAA